MTSINNRSSSDSSSGLDEAIPYRASHEFQNLDDNNAIDGLYKTVTKSVVQDPENNVLTRLSTLSKVLSHMTAQEMQNFQVDPKDFDLKRILDFMMHKSTEQGIQARATDIVFEDFTVIGKNNTASIVKDVSDQFFFPIVALKKKFSKKPQIDLSKFPKTRKIIRNVTGVCESGSMTLVLGRPGAGCSTFLKCIAGENQTYLSTEGEVLFDGIPADEMMKKFKQQVIYNPELDVHFPFLTVEETLKFAVGCKTPAVRIDNVSRNEYINTIKDLYTVLYGLKHVEKTLVGNDFVRGISGGQRKRVSIAEAMATRATVYCFDNATRGLDASTALEFVESLRTMTNVTNATSLVTIYQASESIYKLFDNVSVLYLGRQIYFGPINEGVAYFNKMGYMKAARETSAEFLTAVTDPLARNVYPEMKGKVPNTADEFEEYWRTSQEYKKLLQDIQTKKQSFNPEGTLNVFEKAHNTEKQKFSRSGSKYTVNYFEQMKLCSVRAFQNIRNNKSYTLTLVGAAVIQSLIVGSMYYNTPNSTIGAFSRGGVLFFCVFYFCIMGLAEIASLFENKPIMNKHRGYSFYHPSAELVASTFTQFPVKFVAIVMFSIILYFLANLEREAGKFFAFVLIICLSVSAVNSLFVLLASLCPTLSAANGLDGLFLSAMFVYSSFMIQRPSMYWWFKWFSYMNPMLYGFESLMLIDFRGRKMPCSPAQLVPYGPGYENVSASNQVCAFVGAAASKELYGGENYVSGEIYLSLAFQYVFGHCWRNVGILVGFFVGFLFINAVIVEVYNPLVASSDQLLFIKGAKLPQSLLDLVGVSQEHDPESTSGPSSIEAKREEESELQRGTADGADATLGSQDIFMWQNVNYVVPYEGQDRKLLDDVQGYVLPGTLTALMGESGAGKTTLLNVLSRRVDMGVVTGDMLINGKPIDTSFERRTGYVQQQDLHIAELTVRESLIFASRLRRPASVPDEEKIAYVDQVMEILHMEEYADSVAGQSGYGLNVEQRKKLSIATELVAKPSLLLFLDEPTSGLDSQSSWAIVQVLKSLAAAGQAILCTIHQPSATLFEQFDRLLLLRRGGQTVYFGDVGKHSKTMLEYFESQGARKCSDEENPAEYILEAIGAGATASVDEDWYQKWIESPQYAAVTEEVTKLISDTAKLPASDQSGVDGKYAMPYWYQFKLVLHRTWIQFYRDLEYIMSKFMLMVTSGLLAGFSFWNVKHTSIGMQNVLFAVFTALTLAPPAINQIQARAMQSRELFEVRESKSNIFHWSCLLISQYLVEIPYSIVFSTVYFIAWYFPIQLDNSPEIAGMWWFTMSFFFQLYYISFGLAIVYASKDLPSANVVFGLLFSFIISFCGVVQNPGLLPGFWKFMWRLSPFTYFVESAVSLLLHNRPVVCSSEEMNYLEPEDGLTCGDYLAKYFESNSGYVSNPDDTTNCGVCPYAYGDDYMKTVGMSYSHIWRNVGFFCAYIVFNIFAMLLFYYLLRVKKLSINLASLLPKKKKN